MSRINIVIAENHIMVREAIVSELEAYHINTMAQAGNGAELIEALSQHKPDVILLDIDMPVMDGEEALEIISQEYPDLKIIIVSLHDEEQFIIHLLEAGGRAYVPKDLNMDTLAEAIQKVHTFGYYYDNIPEDVMKAKIEQSNGGYKKKLSNRQTEILPMICDGKTNKEIAEQLKIVTKTVEAHRKIIYSKTNSSCIAELCRYAIKNRLIKA